MLELVASAAYSRSAGGKFTRVELRESHRDDEAHRLMELLDACHRVLSHLGDRQDTIVRAIQETCREVEARLTELGVPYTDTRDQPSVVEAETRAD
jgi:hypothetical protein